jgi:hypothetical protein
MFLNLPAQVLTLLKSKQGNTNLFGEIAANLQASLDLLDDPDNYAEVLNPLLEIVSAETAVRANPELLRFFKLLACSLLTHHRLFDFGQVWMHQGP